MHYREDLKLRARELRANSTPAERKLWLYLRRDQLGIRFYRQRPIDNYIVDFVAWKARLIVELDGGQHFEDEAARYDEKRTRRLEALGYAVLRFDNLQVMKQTVAVVEAIDRWLRERGF